jgi:hypothetical protein
MSLEDPRYRSLYNQATNNTPTSFAAQYLNSRKITPPSENEDVGNMIKRLNTMSRDDPEYGSLYWKTVTADQTGLAVQCITRKPRQESENRVTRDPPPHQNQLPPAPVRPLMLEEFFHKLLDKCFPRDLRNVMDALTPPI